MDLKQIKELMAAMGRGGIKKLTIKEKTGYELHLERHDDHASSSPVIPSYAYPQVFQVPPSSKEAEVLARPSAVPSHKQSSSQETTLTSPEKTGRYVVAPLVGTFYNAPSPESSSFVKVGDRVDENTVVCIIEAMKVMNEVKAGMSGVVEEILVESAHPVEFGTKMFRIV